MGLVHLWTFSFRTTVSSDELSLSYNLAGQVMEQVHISGFNAAEGTSYKYYDGLANALSAGTTGIKFVVKTIITSSAVTSGTIGVAGAVPTSTAIRTVAISARKNGVDAPLYSTSTYLTKGGI